jgi:hypothetical protein
MNGHRQIIMDVLWRKHIYPCLGVYSDPCALK